MKTRIFLLLGAVACGHSACQRVPPADEAAVLAAVRENVAAMEREDMDAVMATIHSEAPQFDSNHDLMQELFERFDLKYTLSELKVVGRKDGEVRVSFIQRTEKAAGADAFKNNTVAGVHALRQEDGRWKIHSTPSTRLKEMSPEPVQP